MSYSAPNDPRKPISPWAYFGLTLLFLTPVAGLVFLVFFSINKKNENIRNFALSFWLILILFAIIIGLLFVTGVATDALTKLGYIKTYK